MTYGVIQLADHIRHPARRMSKRQFFESKCQSSETLDETTRLASAGGVLQEKQSRVIYCASRARSFTRLCQWLRMKVRFNAHMRIAKATFYWPPLDDTLFYAKYQKKPFVGRARLGKLVNITARYYLIRFLYTSLLGVWSFLFD